MTQVYDGIGESEMSTPEYREGKLQEEIDRLTRLCEAKDEALDRIAKGECHPDNPILPSGAADYEWAENTDRTLEHLSAIAEEALSTTSETIAAWRTKETEPLRREVAWLMKGYSEILECEYGEDIDFVCNNVLKSDTQATALAYEQEVEQRGAVKALEEAATELDARHLESLQMCILPSTMVREMAAELRANKGEVK